MVDPVIDNPSPWALAKDKRYAAAWDAYWFPQSTAVRLAVLRVITVGAGLAFFHPPLSWLMGRVNGNVGFVNPEPWIQLLAGVVGDANFRDPTASAAMWWVVMAAGVCSLFGFLGRVTMPVLAVGNITLWTHMWSYGELHHVNTIYALWLLAMALSPAHRAVSVDAWLALRRGKPATEWGPTAVFHTAMWPIRLAQVLLSLMYLSAALSKTVFGTIWWMHGYAVQHHMLKDGVRNNRPIGVWLSQYHLPAMAMSVGSVLFEGLFPLVLFFKRLVPLFLLGGLGLHLGIYVVMGPPFFTVLTLYTIWVPWERLFARRPAAAVTTPPLPATTA